MFLTDSNNAYIKTIPVYRAGSTQRLPVTDTTDFNIKIFPEGGSLIAG
ncbi:MAG: hypothetical protein H7Y86_00745 [Rhizobacter sp.]|nr:hypothetical protein [Ferruginibacter sp.]